MKQEETIGYVTRRVEKSSTDFEKTNTDLKRKYLLWNIEAFNIIASKITGYKGSFGTGYPFYCLDDNMKGTLPIIEEQIRYNRQLVKDGIQFQTSIWKCKSCLTERYDTMPDLKIICKPCPNMADTLKPRKFINRLPDIDMWVICEDGKVERTETEMTELLQSIGMCPSDTNPIVTMKDVENIVTNLKNGEFPSAFLPIDAHIIEYSKIKELIEQVPDELDNSKKYGAIPYLPIHPKSYRKEWQYDDEAYNYIYDYLSAFTPFNFPNNLQKTLDTSRHRVALEHTPEELFSFLLDSATKPNFRRFQSIELEKCFMSKVAKWKEIRISEGNGTDSQGHKNDTTNKEER